MGILLRSGHSGGAAMPRQGRARPRFRRVRRTAAHVFTKY